MWLDRGELDKIIERTSQEAEPAPAARAREPERRPEYRDDDYRRHGQYKRKSLLKDFFDF